MLSSDQSGSFMEPFWWPDPIKSPACPNQSIEIAAEWPVSMFACQICLICMGCGALSSFRCATFPSCLCPINRPLSAACDGEERRCSPGKKRILPEMYPSLQRLWDGKRRSASWHDIKMALVKLCCWWGDPLEHKSCLFTLVGARIGAPADLEGICTVTRL